MKYKPKNVFELKTLVHNETISLGDIDTSNVDNMDSIFEDSTRRDFSGIETWDTSNVKWMVAMFSGAKYFNEDISSWNVSNVIDMAYMFEGAESFNQPLNEWDVRNALRKVYMFKNAVKFDQPLDKWKFFERNFIENLTQTYYICGMFE